MELNIQEALVSVIVPIYNVEKYVRRCLDSLQQQSLKQIEVIMIDDGSTDQSGEIAEQYVTEAGQWPAFRCIHTQNRGLSAARNRGIEEARTEWLMFVDSDDWVEPGYCEIPYKAAVDNNADMVVFNSSKGKKKKTYRDHKRRIKPPEGIIDDFAAYEYGGNEAWNKLYHRHLFETTRYPEGRVYEDIATTYKLTHKANKIVMMQDQLYHYTRRNGSITLTHTPQNRGDRLIAELEREKALLSYGFPDNKTKGEIYSAAIGYLMCTKKEDGELYKQAKIIVDNTETVPNTLNWKQKMAWKAWKTDKRVFYLLCKATGRLKY